MDDRKLLELAAKAAGLALTGASVESPFLALFYRAVPDGPPLMWAPLHLSSDALNLAVKLRMIVNVNHDHTTVCLIDEARSETVHVEQWDDGMTPEEWTRRAIVRAAALSLAEEEQSDG